MMFPLLHQRGVQCVAVLLIAAAPLWCCCAAVLAEMQEYPGTAETCCPSQQRPATPDDPDEHSNCECDHESANWTLPGSAGAVPLASTTSTPLTWTTRSTGDRTGRDVATTVAVGKSYVPAVSLFAQRCALII